VQNITIKHSRVENVFIFIWMIENNCFELICFTCCKAKSRLFRYLYQVCHPVSKENMITSL